jgi:hypothetical protein
MDSIAIEPLEGSLPEDLLAPSPALGAATLWWLGQAGLAVRCGDSRVPIDTYLSDLLARKYAGKEFPHRLATTAAIAPLVLRRRAGALGARPGCLIPDLQHRFTTQRPGGTMSNL